MIANQCREAADYFGLYATCRRVVDNNTVDEGTEGSESFCIGVLIQITKPARKIFDRLTILRHRMRVQLDRCRLRNDCKLGGQLRLLCLKRLELRFHCLNRQDTASHCLEQAIHLAADIGEPSF
ncbi:hypothetical protein [Rhizobium sp. BK491]|uniref:hypothetical protein n=1 Tax=Rhizobium sp. BK491 TaxID=2587009 RepID=UPI0032B20DA2